MHKVRLTQNNYQLVAESSGQSPEVLMSNYNEVLDSEKKMLAMMVEKSFYPLADVQELAEQGGNDISEIMQKIQGNPELFQKILQLLLSNAVGAQQRIVSEF
jgi:spore coat protein CotF